MFWNDAELDMEIVRVNDISDQSWASWVLSAIYASPNPSYRDALWDSVKWLGECIRVPWLILGDCDQVMIDDEK